ncbi:unnamed protein product [Phytophthora fragariaefolia]|uniref:Unnamed protein product n=1 Tax=Phytophthora fragariaefolia TaxID=1490495 RepID=A0A9W6YCF7_9STRA|nr:unnamed protein product [Phytophthora fragariaefolia]
MPSDSLADNNQRVRFTPYCASRRGIGSAVFKDEGSAELPTHIQVQLRGDQFAPAAEVIHVFHFPVGPIALSFYGGSTKQEDGGRGDGGRGEAMRQSCRAQGLPAESHKDLDVIDREARARRKAERDAKEAEDKAKSTEPDAQDDQVSMEAAEEEDLCSESKAERIPEKQAQATETAKVSEGGADVGEPPAADRVSDSPQPEQEEETAKDVPVKVKAEVIEIEGSDAKERSALVDAEVSSRSPQSSSNQAPSSSQSQAPEPEVLHASNPVPAPQSLNADVRPSLCAGAETADTTQLDETAAKTFVARQMYRWEQMRSGRVVSPSVEYAWPNPRPDFSAWQEATMATSDYLRHRMALENRDAAWIAELRPKRRCWRPSSLKLVLNSSTWFQTGS